MTEIYRDGNLHLSQELQDLYSNIANIVGAPNVPLIIQKGEVHGASTDSKKVFMGTNYVDQTISENYHGFPNDLIAANVAFTIGHELGHITVHPGRGVSWRDEITALPIDAYEQRDMANIISDIMVNYMISRGTNFIEQGTEFGDELKKHLMGGHLARSFFRIAWTDEERARVAILLQRGENNFGQPMVDNRYTPPASTGLVQGDYYPNAGRDTPQMPSRDPANPTPLYQENTGYGRGSQVYPPLQYCVSNNNPQTGSPYPDNWKSVRVNTRHNVQYCSRCKKYQVYQDAVGTCPICLEGTTSSSTIRPGVYTVTGVMTYSGEINPTMVQPIANYQISGNWIPARYCEALSPDTGFECNPNWFRHFGFPEVVRDDMARYTFGTRFMLMMEWAANYALLPEGYGGSKGRLAAEKFIKDIGYELHAATMEAGGVGA